MTTAKTRLGITTGDPNGIGLELILKTFSDERLLQRCIPVLYGSNRILSYHRKTLDLPEIRYRVVTDPGQGSAGVLNIINTWEEEVEINLGKVTETGGRYAFRSFEAAANDLLLKKTDALVTAPIHKAAVRLSGAEITGHTEYLARIFNAPDHLMLMVSEGLRVGTVTGHVPVREVAPLITKERLLSKLTVLHHSLLRDFGKERPAIAVLGLNPHAGDSGIIGTEDRDIILPAIEAAKEKGILAFGPFAADGLFGSGAAYRFDAVLAMYHDQGLAPFKAVAFDGGVNFTAGLQAVRTSPGHGPAFEIAGKNQANTQSFLNALYCALDVVQSRKDHDESRKNPLQKSAASHEQESTAAPAS